MKKVLQATALTVTIATSTSAMAEFDRVRWQVPMGFPSTLTALGDTMPEVAKMVSDISGGRVTLQTFEPGKLIPSLGVFENVSNGNLPAGYSWMGYEWGQIPASALFGATPFGLESQEFLAWMYHHDGDKLLKELFQPYNVYPILCGTISPEAAGWFREEMDSLDKFKGLKFRAAGVGGEIMSEFGMSVTLLPGGELYQALETGVLDATEFSMPTVDEQLGFYQVAKHYYLPGWHQPSTNQFLYINLDEWKKLNGETQALIETSCKAANTIALAKAEALQGAVLKRFKENGVQLHQYSPEILNAFEEATDRVMKRRSESDPMFAKVYDSMKAFQAEHAAWKKYGYLPRDWGMDE
ncbi:TRAP transporter substrate-binding protein [Marinobacterium sp. D7]|uniref:TRAP transporter substrate-binding protein n=1 Tax=Marinobacterium ramblicola TaxID=2849041 RepID=UPI001C2D22EE|nr:TRAP transporter substrate-binding protein [Marinobacterium ramblicola]MBV1788216.1 TRAP transporter substrate-binding protein [Marinobacterium ramblicola]